MVRHVFILVHNEQRLRNENDKRWRNVCPCLHGRNAYVTLYADRHRAIIIDKINLSDDNDNNNENK